MQLFYAAKGNLSIINIAVVRAAAEERIHESFFNQQAAQR